MKLKEPIAKLKPSELRMASKSPKTTAKKGTKNLKMRLN